MNLSSELITVEQCLRYGTELLNQTSITPRLDSEIILSYIIGLDRLNLISTANTVLPSEVINLYLENIKKRKDGLPVAYITEIKEFFGLNFYVNKSVLIPRPETEILIDHGLKFCRYHGKKLNILEMGTGSGCISIALATLLKLIGLDFQITAIDYSEEAINIAKKNASANEVESQITFLKSNWYESLTSDIRYDLIISNPPYISDEYSSFNGVGSESLSLELKFEPKNALFASDNGLSDIKKILIDLPNWLNPERIYLLKYLADNIKLSSYKYDFIKDYSRLDRVLIVTLLHDYLKIL
jgi:release factor glutamine methyltransferase